MKLLETYSRNCSVEIKHKPFLAEKYFPLVYDKYITLQTKSGMPAKEYSHFREVISLLFPILEKEGIKIVHLGQESQPIQNTINLNNQTSIGQAAYIVKRSLLHFGSDSWMAHFAGANNIPLVTLFGSTTVENHSPYFYNKDKTIFLESHRNGNKATFSREETPKTIDLINPEEVAAAVCKLLNLEFSYPYSTLEIGNSYSQGIVEAVMDNPINISNLGINNLVVRMDLLFNEHILYQQLQHCKCAILTDRPIDEKLLQAGRQNILEIVYEIKKETTNEFCFLLQKLRIPHRLFSDLPEEELKEKKLDFIDFPIIGRRNIEKPSKIDLDNLDNIYFKTSKIILARGKIYNSIYNYKLDIPQADFNQSISSINKKGNINDLWIDRDYILFLKKS